MQSVAKNRPGMQHIGMVCNSLIDAAIIVSQESKSGNCAQAKSQRAWEAGRRLAHRTIK